MIIDQQAAHERILYEKYLQTLNDGHVITQQQLFPQALEFSPADAILFAELEQDRKNLGFDIRPFGKNTYVIHGLPAEVKQGEERQLIEGLIENLKHTADIVKLEKKEKLALAMAKNMAVKQGRTLSQTEMRTL